MVRLKLLFVASVILASQVGADVAQPPRIISCLSAMSSRPDGLHVGEAGESTYVVEYYEGGQLLGQTKYYLAPEVNRISINMYQVRESARGRGVSEKMLRKVVELAGPTYKSVDGYLAYTNYATTLAEYEAISTPQSSRYDSSLTTNERNILAVSASPFVKSFSKLGFTEVKLATFEWVTVNGPPYISQITVILSKPN